MIIAMCVCKLLLRCVSYECKWRAGELRRPRWRKGVLRRDHSIWSLVFIVVSIEASQVEVFLQLFEHESVTLALSGMSVFGHVSIVRHECLCRSAQ